MVMVKSGPGIIAPENAMMKEEAKIVNKFVSIINGIYALPRNLLGLIYYVLIKHDKYFLSRLCCSKIKDSA